MTDRQAELGCDLFQRKSPPEIGLELFPGLPCLPRAKTPAGRCADALQPAIGPGDVGGEGQHHVIDKELVDLVRPAQPLLQRRTEMTDDLVVMTDAELKGELIDARCAGLLSDAV